MVTISGRVVRGLGAANQTLRHQLPGLLKVCPELRGCFCGTINVILDCQLEVISPDHIAGPIDWTGSGNGELFGLRKILLEIHAGQLVEAWIYIAYGSPHRSNPYYAEILAPQIELKGGVSNCKIHFAAARRVLA